MQLYKPWVSTVKQRQRHREGQPEEKVFVPFHDPDGIFERRRESTKGCEVKGREKVLLGAQRPKHTPHCLQSEYYVTLHCQKKFKEAGVVDQQLYVLLLLCIKS